jgi:hypothetical protein
MKFQPTNYKMADPMDKCDKNADLPYKIADKSIIRLKSSLTVLRLMYYSAKLLDQVRSVARVKDYSRKLKMLMLMPTG